MRTVLLYILYPSVVHNLETKIIVTHNILNLIYSTLGDLFPFEESPWREVAAPRRVQDAKPP